MTKLASLLLASASLASAQWGDGGLLGDILGDIGQIWGGLDGQGWLWGKGHHHMPPVPWKSTGVQNATFQQVLDHSDPSDTRTFSQFYYYSTEYWKGPGEKAFARSSQMLKLKILCSQVLPSSSSLQAK